MLLERYGKLTMWKSKSSRLSYSLIESLPPEEVLPEDGLYRYLLQPGEEHDDQRCRATDRIWSKRTYRLREIVKNPGNHVMYYLRIMGSEDPLNGPE